MSGREYDLVVFGATGFTGSMTARYLAAHAPATLRWAIAGRSRAKLDQLKARLRAEQPSAARVGTLVASVGEPDSLQRLAAATQVLITTVGPFIDHGEPVVRACLDQRTDYVDITGEPNYIQLLLARYANAAAERGVRVVPSCGFDAIPADLGALFTVLQLPPDQPIELAGYLSFKATFSGGTEQSAIKSALPGTAQLEVPPPAVPDGRRVSAGPAKIEKRTELGKWCSPLPTVDGPIVLRSAAASERYGPDFKYSHNVVHASLPVMLATGMLFGMLGLFVRLAPLRALILKLAKQSGEGPSEEAMKQHWFKVRFIAKCAGKVLQTEVAGGDPGYVETSKMLAEAGMCLAQDRERLPARAGVLTPATAMGEVLLARLQRAGLGFRVL